MLPGDDQLVPYGEDTSVSITRTFPAATQTTTVERIEAIRADNKEDGEITGVTLVHKKVKTTHITLKNNATERTVPQFYIDHSADNAHGGFVITTEANAIKAVTGWTRYCYSIAPEEEIECDVEEEAHFMDFLKARSTAELLESNVLSAELHATLRGVVD